MKYAFYIAVLFMFGCGPAENEPIFVNVSGLAIEAVNLPEGMDLLSFGSVSIDYGLRWDKQGGHLSAGQLEDVRLQPNEPLVYGGMKDMGVHRIWEDNSSCRCDQNRPKDLPILSTPRIKICSPTHLSMNGSHFEGEISNSCVSVEATDYESTTVGVSVSSDISLDFTDAFTTTDFSGLCFRNNSTSICLHAFKASVRTSHQ